MANTPVAIRIARPYSSEEAFLEHEIDTLTRTSVILIGAQSRPQGVVLRFEVTLASGAPLLRGEGRVVGYKQNAFGEEPGLTLRFTRLDPRSKALVDRAAAIRDARARGAGRNVAPQPPPPPGPISFHPAGTDEPTQIGPPPSALEPPPTTAIPSGGVPPPPDGAPGSAFAPPSRRTPPVDGAPGSAFVPPSRAKPPPPPSRPKPPADGAPGSAFASPSRSAFAPPSRPKPVVVASDVPPVTRPRPPVSSPPASARSRETTAYDPETIERLRSASVEEAPPPTTVNASQIQSSDRTLSESPQTPAPPTAAAPPKSVPGPGPRTARASVAPPHDRAALLERLRERARGLAPSRINAILSRA